MNIALRNVTKKFGSSVAIDDVCLEITPGRIVALVGANGAGKSTLLRLLAGVQVPSKGTIEYDGEAFYRDRIDMRQRLSFLPDLPAVFPERTAIQHIGMCLRLYETHRAGVEELCVSLLRDFDLLPLAEVPLRTLSRGQVYKAALAGLIAVDPEVWLFDEPFASGMDPRGLSAFRRLAQKAVARGRTIIYSTQIVEVAETFSDEVLIIGHGKVKAHDSIANLKKSRDDGDHVLERVLADLRLQP